MSTPTRRPSLGPLATYAEPHAYDLCDVHCERLSAPAGLGGAPARARPRRVRPSQDDLLALADAVREAGRPSVTATRSPGEPRHDGAGRETARRGHLRVLTTD